jgi:hypothetical protein
MISSTTLTGTSITTGNTGLGIGSTPTVTWPSNEFLINNKGTYSTVNLGQISISNNYIMENNTSQPQQVQVAVFEIERNEDLEVVSTKHVDTFWIEQKPKSDLKFAVAKKLAKDVDLDKIVIRETFRVSF